MSEIDRLRAAIAELKTPLISSPSDATNLRAELEKYNDNAVMLAGFMGWNTALNVMLDIITEQTTQETK